MRRRVSVPPIATVALAVVAVVSAARASAATGPYSMTANFPVPTYSSFTAVDPGTHTVYVSDGGNSVSAIDGASHAVTATAVVGGAAYDLAVDQTTHDVFVTAYNDGAVTVLDGTTMAVKAVIPVYGAPYAVAVDSLTHAVYAGSLATSAPAQPSPDVLTVIDGSKDTVVKTLTLIGSPYSIAVDPSTRKVYVSLSDARSVLAVDEATDTVVATIDMNTEPGRLAIDPTTHRVYVADYDASRIRVIDESTEAVIGDITTDGSPQGLAIDPTTGTLYACTSAAQTVQVIDTSVSSVVATVHVADCSLVAVDTSTHLAYVTYFDTAAGRNTYSRMMVIGAGLRTSVVGLSARSGPTSGGQPVVLTGDHFAGARSVTFGGARASFTLDSDSQITAVSPPHAAGRVSVQVRTRAGGRSVALPENRYLYVAA